MPDKKYTDDPDIVSLTGTERSPIAKAGVDYYFTPAEMLAFISANYTGSGIITSTGVITSGTWSGKFAPRVRFITSSATPTPNIDDYDIIAITALAINTVFANPTGTPAAGQILTLRIIDDGTPRTIGFGTAYSFLGVSNPGTTTANRTVYYQFEWNNSSSKWECILCTDSSGGGTTIYDISSIRYSGKYYAIPYTGNLNTSLAGYVGAVYMFPVPIGEDHSISALRFKVTSAVALSTIEIGIWGDNGSGLPGTLLLDSGLLPTTSTGDKTYSFPSNISLSGKLFFYGIICSDNISLLGTNNPLPLLERASGSDSAPSAVACNAPFTSNPSLYPVTHYNTPVVEFLKV